MAPMIDTIVLILGPGMFAVTQPDMFTSSARWVNAVHAPFGIASKQNPTARELCAGLYKPRLTLTRRLDAQGVSAVSLKIELSLPKLLFGENFSELGTRDFQKVVQKLTEALGNMGVIVTPEVLDQATVAAVHYSKNIPLTDGTTPYHFINKIKDANIKLSLDVNQTDYRNDGHSYRWHCNSYEVIFYDKIKDLEAAKKSGKRAIEKDPTSLFELRRTGSTLQLPLFDRLRKKKKFEVLRMEVRLNKRDKIKRLFAALGIKSDLTLKGLFKTVIARKVLLHYLDELESKRPAMLDYRAANDKALLTALILNNPDLSSKQILNMFGLKRALESVSIRELRAMFTKSTSRGFARLMGEATLVKVPVDSNVFGALRRRIK